MRFNANFKVGALRAIDKAIEKAVRANAKLTLNAPKEKGAKGWTLDASLVSLAPDKTNKKLEAKVSMVISTWPGKSVKAMPSGSAAVALTDASKANAGDADAVAGAAAEGGMQTGAKYMADTAP